MSDGPTVEDFPWMGVRMTGAEVVARVVNVHKWVAALPVGSATPVPESFSRLEIAEAAQALWGDLPAVSFRRWHDGNLWVFRKAKPE